MEDCSGEGILALRVFRTALTFPWVPPVGGVFENRSMPGHLACALTMSEGEQREKSAGFSDVLLRDTVSVNTLLGS